MQPIVSGGSVNWSVFAIIEEFDQTYSQLASETFYSPYHAVNSLGLPYPFQADLKTPPPFPGISEFELIQGI